MRFIALLICFFLVRLISAQHPFYVLLNDENGLPSNEVYQVLQDQQHYMWVACEEGLFRFDGTHYKKYIPKQQYGVAISDLRLDKNNQIWCRNFTGQIYKVEKSHLRTIVDTRNTISTNVFDIDDDGNMWCVTNNALQQFNENGKRINFYTLKNLKTSPFMVSVCCFKKDVYFSDVAGNVVRFSKEREKFSILSYPKQENTSFTVQLLKSEGKIYSCVVNSKNGDTHIYQIKNNSLKPIYHFLQAPNDRINQLTTQQGKWYFSSSNGLMLPESKINATSQMKRIFSGRKISGFYQDREGAQWVTTLQDGIFYVPTPSIQIKDDFQGDNHLTALSFDKKDEIGIGTFGGLIHFYHIRTKKSKTIPANAGDRSVKKIVYHQKKWFVARGPLTCIENTRITELPLYNCRDFIFENENLHYVCSQVNGTTQLKNLVKNESPYGINHNAGGRCVYFDTKTNSIFLGLNSGLYFRNNHNSHSIDFNKNAIITYQLFKAKDIVFAATINHGLLFLKHNKIIDAFNKENGFENEIKLVTASNKNLWFCSSTYLYKYNFKSKKSFKFAKWFGINAKSINDILTYRDTLYLATDKGLIFFPEKLNGINPVPTYLNVEKITYNHQVLPLNKTIFLPYNHKEIIFHLGCVSLKGRGVSKIRYRLLGLSNQWRYLSTASKEISFEKTPSGQYRLEIQTINESSIAGKKWQFEILIDKPYWEKWWFYLLISISSMTLIGIIFLWQIRMIRQRSELSSKMLQAQLTALKAQMNPHFMYNALNSIQALILQQDAKNASIYLSKFSKLMRIILEESGKSEISLKEEMDMLSLYLELEKLRFGDDFTFEISLQENMDEYNLFLPPVLLQPFVENALKHGLLHKKGLKFLRIHFEEKESVLIVSIIDNGIGRNRAQEIKNRRQNEHKSFASSAIEQQVKLLNIFHGHAIELRIEDLSELGESIGTKVLISIPQSSFGN